MTNLRDATAATERSIWRHHDVNVPVRRREVRRGVLTQYYLERYIFSFFLYCVIYFDNGEMRFSCDFMSDSFNVFMINRE